ncbi:bifunctional metallophosphatase/5'-nucleotidase [Desulfovibrio piger]|mgnify:FL=1|uniref:bifunctional metallophosphatase/5'-nucleotidase n=1 Tax=Desulfovibrio piger TaxID=901 RepID=UPI003A8E4C87
MHHLSRERTLPSPFTALLCTLFLILTACAPAHHKATPDDGLELRLLHVNDTHAFLAGLNDHMNACFEATDCRGGLARISAAIRAARQEQDNIIALDAGDQFQGTLFYSVNKWPMIAAADALLPYDAITLGNHEFDEGCRELARFLEAQPLPVLAANLVPQQGCPLAGSRIRPYLVRMVRGTRVGVIGLANDEVTGLAAACPQTAFRDARTTLQRYVTELEAQGIRHIIAVTHLGLERDRELARSVNGIDVIVGGHTHTYLGPGSKDGPYPIVEHAPDGSPVLVVTAARATRYLGDLSITFDAVGIPVAWTGGPRELVSALPQDEAMTRLVANYAESLERYRTEIVGRHNIQMPDGMEACRKGDCFSGLLTADAFLEYGRTQGARLALVNGGGIRASLPAGDISRGDLLALHPFDGQVYVREYSGQQIREALEHAVSGPDGEGPQLLQVAGLTYEADTSRPAGQRLRSVHIVDEQGQRHALDPQRRYGVVLSDFLASGGDGFGMLRHGRLLATSPLSVRELTGDYIRRHSPLAVPHGKRIILYRANGQSPQ